MPLIDPASAGLQSAAATRMLAVAWLARTFGIHAELHDLPGEFDLNIEARAASGRYVLKIMREGCDPTGADADRSAPAPGRAGPWRTCSAGDRGAGRCDAGSFRCGWIGPDRLGALSKRGRSQLILPWRSATGLR